MSSNSKVIDNTSWQALTYFNLYRFLIAFLFVSLYWIGQLPQPLGTYDTTLFSLTAHFFLLSTVVAQAFISIKHPRYVVQVAALTVADIMLITLLMYASSGLNSGFGMLLIIAVAGGSVLSSGRIGILYAAISAIAVLGHEVYVQLKLFDVIPNYTHAGLLGITFFVTAFISHALARRVEISEALAKQRAIDLQNLARLNEHIVRRLQSGIIVLDDNFRILISNVSANNLLDIKEESFQVLISEVSSHLGELVNDWQFNNGRDVGIIKSKKGDLEIQISLSRISLEDKFEILIFLEDMSVMRQHAQQMKLASLGRLTASIAHEIRNPLGAISHAGQLLCESEKLDNENKRLTSIIVQHSSRVNNIIENIMNISRRDQSVPTPVVLGDWLKNFKDEFTARNELSSDEIKLDIDSGVIHANMDQGQLHQVLWNLCENGLRYSRKNPKIELKCSVTKETQRPYIDVIDNGIGIKEEIEEQLFEPFITTNPTGTGLGLYIARELCEANQATLNLYENSIDGCCFRINFSHPDKQHRLV